MSSTTKEEMQVVDKTKERMEMVPLVLKQILLNLCYAMLAVTTLIRGPCLLDLTEIYETDIETISIGISLASIAGIFGNLLMGYLWNKLHKYKYFLTFSVLSLLSILSSLFPHCGNLIVFFINFTVIGFLMASLHTVSNVLCMEFWHGRNGGPAMNSMHALFSLGAFISPIISKPFLSRTVFNKGHEGSLGNATLGLNSTRANESLIADEKGSEDQATQITILFPLTGLVMLILSTGFLILGINNLRIQRRRKASQANGGSKKRPNHFSIMALPTKKKIMVAIMLLFMSIYMGIEFTHFSYIPTFAVKSNYKMTKEEGANLMALYLLAYLIARVSGIFLSMRISPFVVLCLNATFMTTGTIILLIAMDHNLTLTMIGYAVTGLGTGSTFANILTWLHRYVVMSSQITSALTIGCGIGVNIAPLVVGQLIDTVPLVPVYLQAFTIVTCILLFLTARWIGEKALREERAARQIRAFEEDQEKDRLNKEQQTKVETEEDEEGVDYDPNFTDCGADSVAIEDSIL